MANMNDLMYTFFSARTGERGSINHLKALWYKQKLGL